jgi:hypothetical protein
MSIESATRRSAVADAGEKPHQTTVSMSAPVTSMPAEGFQLIRIAACNSAISGSILARPATCFRHHVGIAALLGLGVADTQAHQRLVGVKNVPSASLMSRP